MYKITQAIHIIACYSCIYGNDTILLLKAFLIERERTTNVQPGSVLLTHKIATEIHGKTNDEVQNQCFSHPTEIEFWICHYPVLHYFVKFMTKKG